MRKSLLLFTGILIFNITTISAKTEYEYPIPKDTELMLPSKLGITVSWVIPVDPKITHRPVKKSDYLCFDVDKKGNPWFGFKKNVLINPLGQVFIKFNKSYEDFVWLDNNKFILSSQTDLGLITKIVEDGNSIPTAQFQPVLPLPYKKMKLCAGEGENLYLVGRNIETKKFEVFILRKTRGKGIAEKLFTTKKEIFDVAGNGEKTYVAMGRLIIQLLPEQHDVELILQHPDCKIVELEFCSKSGLFYATDRTVGYVGKNGRFEFMKSPDTQIRLQDESLFVLLGKTHGVLRIDGINKFKNLKVGSSERQTQPLQTQTWKQLADINSDLIEAARVGDTAKVKQLIKQGADVNAKNKDGKTVLMFAVSSGQAGTVKVLIDAGAGVNARDESSWTALMWASAYIDIAKALIDAGAEVKVEGGDTAMAVAAQNDHMDNIMRLLKQAVAKGQTVSEEARRHMVRGQAAVGIARTWQDYEIAIQEFEQAAKLAPDWPEIYYNLGVVQEKAGQYGEAIENLKKYLALAPDASDAEQARELIYKVEKEERELLDPNSLVGIWWLDIPGYDHEKRGWRFGIRNNNGKVEARALVALIEEPYRPKGKFVPIQWDGKRLKISRAVYYDCDVGLDPNWCPCESTYNLTRVSVDRLEGEIEVSGIYYPGPRHFKSKYTRVWIRRK